MSESSGLQSGDNLAISQPSQTCGGDWGGPANLALITDPQEFDLEYWRIGNTDDDLVMFP